MKTALEAISLTKGGVLHSCIIFCTHLLAVQLDSSEKSLQSLSPSHTQACWTQSPLSHLNSSAVQFISNPETKYEKKKMYILRCLQPAQHIGQPGGITFRGFERILHFFLKKKGYWHVLFCLYYRKYSSKKKGGPGGKNRFFFININKLKNNKKCYKK